MRSVAATLAVTAALALTGCATPGAAVSDPQLNGTWHLASGSDHGRGLVIDGAGITLRIGDAAHTGGDDPCSSYRATVTGGVGVVYIRAALTGGTRDECTTPGLARLEQLYLTALTASRFASLNQGALVLSSPTSSLVFVPTAPAPVADLRRTSWQLYAIPAQVPATTSGPGIHAVRLGFDGSDGFILSSPCVTASGHYQIAGENFAMVPSVTTPGSGIDCTETDRGLAGQAQALFEGPLLLDVSSAGSGGPAMLVVTNLDDGLPIVWRAVN